MNQGKTVLVLGGGVGGVVAARRLRSRLPARDRVVVIDREPQHLFAPSLLWLAVGQRRPDQIQRPLERLRKRGIEVEIGEIEAIEPEARAVRVSGTRRTADAIVISLGAAYAPERVPGLAEAGHNAYTLAGAAALRADLEGRTSGRIVVLTAAPAYRCPAAPYELALLIESRLRRRGVRDGFRIEVHAAEPAPMGVAGAHVSAAVRELLAGRDIGYHPGRTVTGVEPGGRVLRFDDDSSVGFDVLAYVPPHRAPAVVTESGLAGSAGWIAVDRSTMTTGVPGVYAIGDVTTIPLAVGKPLPKAGVFAHAQAEVVAENLAAEWAGRTPTAAFDGHGACFIETGDGRAGYGSGDFYAEPAPEIRLHPPGRRWHLGKVLFEKTWWWRWL